MSEEAASKPTQTYQGCCHCQAVKFTVELPNLEGGGVCDCSHCSKRGIVWGFAPPGSLKLEKGEDVLTKYQFGDKNYTLLSCPNCATFIFGSPYDPTKMQPFNMTALRNINYHDLKTEKYSGIDRPPKYAFPEAPANDFHTDGKKLYTGSCHCQAVTFVLESDPLEKGTVLSCNCSMCGGNGCLWVYPKKASVKFSPTSEENMQEYRFGTKKGGHHFCKTCFCNIYNQREGSEDIGLNARLFNDWIGYGNPRKPTEGVEEVKEEDKKKGLSDTMHVQPVNGATDWGEKYVVV